MITFFLAFHPLNALCIFLDAIDDFCRIAISRIASAAAAVGSILFTWTSFRCIAMNSSC